jgi:hypothetical protein
LYLRLATATPAGAQQIAERSPIKEWLAGSRTGSSPAAEDRHRHRRDADHGADRQHDGAPTTTTGSNELRLMEKEREQARQDKEQRDKQRRNELEGKEASARNTVPFEDFDLASRSTRSDGRRIITRAFTAGPGDYDLFLAWADPSSSKPAATVQVVRKSITLEPARTIGLITEQRHPCRQRVGPAGALLPIRAGLASVLDRAAGDRTGALHAIRSRQQTVSSHSRSSTRSRTTPACRISSSTSGSFGSTVNVNPRWPH